ncbi:MAG: hypothetical protein JSV09_13295 [Thermoplasmata archaeon]|nr:MAG: hypothetical protein JSV09_13295 [Thermoplasmata archaeon]
MKKICCDEKARASFALVGLFILFIGSMNALYLADVNNDFRGSYVENKEISQMVFLIDKAHIEVQSAAYFKAQEAIGSANLERNFTTDLKNYLNDIKNFPKRVSKYKITIYNHYANISENAQNIYEISGEVTYIISNRETENVMERTMSLDRRIDPSNL